MEGGIGKMFFNLCRRNRVVLNLARFLLSLSLSLSLSVIL